jgi:hypothetical protein
MRRRLVYAVAPPVLIFGFLADMLGLWTLPGLLLGLVWAWVVARRPRRTGRRIVIYSTIGSVVLLFGTAFVIVLLFAAYG